MIRRFFFLAIFMGMWAHLAGAVDMTPPNTWITTLQNGMRVICIEDHSTPLVASVLCIRAGSRTETPADNGMSHLLEHLLFDGTETFSREELAEAVENEGGYFNAFTRMDYVIFEMVMPPESIGRGMALQAEQVLKSVIPEEEFEKEKKVVCEEIAKDARRFDNLADEYLMRMLFGDKGYGLPVLGNYDTVNAMHRETLLKFYKSRYVPNLMTLVIVGDISPAAAVREARNLYGDVPAGMTPMGLRVQPDFSAPRRMAVREAPVHARVFNLAMPAPPPGTRENLAATLAVQLWSQGEGSPLSRALVAGDDAIAAQAWAWLDDHDGFSLLKVSVMPGESLDIPDDEFMRVVMERISASLARAAGSLDADALRRAASMMRTDHVLEREKFNHWAWTVARYDAFGALDAYRGFDEMLQAVTIDDVRGFLETLRQAPSAGVYLVPGAPQDAGGSGGAPALEAFTLDNGMRVIAWQDVTSPVFAANLLVRTPDDTPPGARRMVSALLDKGAAGMDGPAIENRLAELGVRIQLEDNPWIPFDDYYQTPEYAYFRLETITTQAEPALAMMRAMAYGATLPESAVRQAKQRLMMRSRRRMQHPGALCSDALKRLLFPGSLYAHPLIPAPETLEALTRETLMAYYNAAYTARNSILCVIDRRPVRRLREMVEKVFSDIPAGNAFIRNSPIAMPEPRELEISVPSEQEFVCGGVFPGIAPEELPEWMIAARILSKRLAETIREKKGMAYSVSAGLNISLGMPALSVSAGTRAGNRREVMGDVKAIIDGMPRYPLSSEELQRVIRGISGQRARYRQRRINRAHFLCLQEYLGNGFKADAELTRRIRNATRKDVQEVLRRMPPAHEWVWVYSTATSKTDGE